MSLISNYTTKPLIRLNLQELRKKPLFFLIKFLKGSGKISKGGVNMELYDRKIEELNKQPVIESKIWKSKDNLWIVHETRILDFKPRTFFEKVLNSIEEEVIE